MLIIRTNTIRLPEKEYCFKVLLEAFLGLPYRVETTPDILDFQLVLPNGKQITLTDSFVETSRDSSTFSPISTLNEGVNLPHPFRQDLPLPVICGNRSFHKTEEGFACGLDIFASSFFMLSRWEEYVSTEHDGHGRFPAAASMAYREGFLQRPVVNEYLDLLWDMLVALGWNQPRKQRNFHLHLSHDVDHPLLWWSPRDRLRTLAGSLLKRRDVRETRFWLQPWKEDPFDTFDEMMDWSEQAGVQSHFNFLGKREHHSDCFYPLGHPFVQNLMHKITDRGHVIGFHPSYEAFGHAAKFNAELESLRALSPQVVRTGRQHYLRFSVPDTWQVWENAGMEWDSTVGYADAPGFRCGTCYEFPVFNILTRQTLSLREKPLVAMDVTLALYNNSNPQEALTTLNRLQEEVKKHQGEFVLLWHNSSLNDYFWKDWKTVYQSFINP